MKETFNINRAKHSRQVGLTALHLGRYEFSMHKRSEDMFTLGWSIVGGMNLKEYTGFRIRPRREVFRDKMQRKNYNMRYPLYGFSIFTRYSDIIGQRRR